MLIDSHGLGVEPRTPTRRGVSEGATLSWVHWHNTTRLHGYLNDVPPAEFEAIFYATKRTDQPLVEI